MSYIIHEQYGKEIKKFILDGSHPSQDAILINGNFIIYEKGLLIKGLEPLSPIYTKWRNMYDVTLYEGEDTKVIINLKDGVGEIIAESKGEPEKVIEFYDLVEAQREKYRYFDELRQIEVDLDDISIIMNTDRSDNQAYFDTITGEIIYVPVELNEDNVYDDEYVAGLAGWEKEIIAQVKAIYEDEDGRYDVVPEKVSYEAYDIMIQFVRKLDDLNISEKLFDALDGKGAFRKFKNVIGRYPEIEKQWYKFKEDVEKQEVREWLWRIGIEPIEE